MYDELVKNLRGRSQFLLPHYGEETSYDSDLMKQAADAIEDLEFACNHYEKDYKDLCAYLPKWIPVTERLPESVHEYVLCCGAKGGQFVGWVGTGFITGGKVMAFQHGGKGRYITHWMPLPQPPKEG